MSIIAAGTTTTTALSSTGNTDGTLQLQVNGTTPSVTLNTLGAIGVGSSPNYGTSGQALVSSGSTAAPTWASVTTSPAGSTGQVQYNNAGAFGAISSGTSGQVLTSAGSGAAPTWTTPSGGIASITAGAGLSGGTITTSGTVAIDTNNYAGVGGCMLLYDPGSTAAGGTAAGSSLTPAGINGSSLSWVVSGTSPSGTWRNLTGFASNTTNRAGGLFIRIA